jgi:hypothetical protein
VERTAKSFRVDGKKIGNGIPAVAKAGLHQRSGGLIGFGVHETGDAGATLSTYDQREVCPGTWNEILEDERSFG